MPDTRLYFGHPLPGPAMQTADGFVVVSRLMLKPWVPPGKYDYSYTHYDNLPDADEHYRALEAGEYGQWQAHAIIPTLRGIPLGSKVVP